MTFTDTRPADYDAVIDAVRDGYEDRILAFLVRCRDFIQGELGLVCSDPVAMHTDDYNWGFHTMLPNSDVGDGCVDFTVEIAEAAAYGDEPPYGVNFGLGIVEYGGLLVGGLTPFNYTELCWVDATNRAALDDRWQYFEDADVESLRELLAPYVGE